MAKHHREVEARRHAMLDAYEAEGRDDVRALAGALVRPLASKLADEDGGAQYLQILADLINRPRPVINPADLDDPTSSIFRWRNLVGRLLEDDATFRTGASWPFASPRSSWAAGPATLYSDDRLFTSHLVDLVAGVLTTPLSDETRRLAAERP